MIYAEDRKTVKGDVFYELVECGLQRFERTVMIQVFSIDIGDDGRRRRQFDEGAIALVRLYHHPVTGAQISVGTVGIEDPAVNHRRIHATGHQQRRNERGRGRLTMSAANSDGPFQPH